MPKPALDAYITDVLMRDLTGHERKPSAFIVYLYLWTRTAGVGERSTRASHRMLADATGLSKSAVQAGIRLLVRRRLVQSRRASRTAVPEYTVNQPWLGRGAGPVRAGAARPAR